MREVNATTFQRAVGQHIDHVRTTGEPIVLRVHGRSGVVITREEDFNRMARVLDEYVSGEVGRITELMSGTGGEEEMYDEEETDGAADTDI